MASCAGGPDRRRGRRARCPRPRRASSKPVPSARLEHRDRGARLRSRHRSAERPSSTGRASRGTRRRAGAGCAAPAPSLSTNAKSEQPHREQRERPMSVTRPRCDDPRRPLASSAGCVRGRRPAATGSRTGRRRRPAIHDRNRSGELRSVRRRRSPPEPTRRVDSWPCRAIHALARARSDAVDAAGDETGHEGEQQHERKDECRGARAQAEGPDRGGDQRRPGGAAPTTGCCGRDGPVPPRPDRCRGGPLPARRRRTRRRLRPLPRACASPRAATARVRGGQRTEPVRLRDREVAGGELAASSPGG